ncbi:MAG: alpha-E domain-containing protein [Rhodothermales bacterium]
MEPLLDRPTTSHTLSRVADSLLWMARYLERAEHTARLLDLNLHALLDQSAARASGRWMRVLHSLSFTDARIAEQPLRDWGTALAFDPDLPDSIPACIAAARTNAREVREQISTEMWNQLNHVYLQVGQITTTDHSDIDTHDYLHAVKNGIHLFRGIAASTVSHDERWQFMRLGHFLERISLKAQLLAIHTQSLGLEHDPADTEYYLEWVSVLKSCTAFEPFCRQYSAQVDPKQAVEFLLLSPVFPHALRFSASRAREAVHRLSNVIPALRNSDAQRLAGRLVARLSYDNLDDVLEADLPGYLRDIQAQCAAISAAVYRTSINYTIVQRL